MHIALVSDDYPPENFKGGIGAYTQALAHSLVALGHSVTVITWTAGRSQEREDDGVRIRSIPAYGSRLVGGQRLVSPLRWSVGVYTCLRKLHKSERIDVVESPDFRGEGAVTALQGVYPTLVRGHGTLGLTMELENKSAQSRSIRLLLALERMTVQHAALVVTNSDYLSGWYQALYSLPSTAIAAQPYGLSSGVTLVSEKKTALESDAVTFLNVGRQEWRKGSDSLVRAFARADVPGKRLIMIGGDTDTAPDGGSMRQLCRALAQELEVGDRVEILEQIPQEDLRAHYLASDVFVTSSRSDTTLLVHLEAMANGLPIIGTSVGGVPEIVPPECGVLIPSDDLDSLATAMERLGTQPGLRQTMGETGRKLAHTKYMPSRHAEHMVRHYEQAIANHRQRRR